MILYLRSNYLNNIFWWDGASYDTHWDCNRHTGAVMLMGAGEILSFSRNHKLNTGISIEAELEGIADALFLMMWNKYFMEAQGYIIDSNILFRYNQSTIMLANNGRRSADKKSKHAKNLNLLITDKVHQENPQIRYMLTGEILADYQSNTHQGKLFCTMRAHLMNFPIDYDDDKECRKTLSIFLPKIKAGTNGEELKKNPVRDSMKSNKTVTGKLQMLTEMECMNLQRSCC